MYSVQVRGLLILFTMVLVAACDQPGHRTFPSSGGPGGFKGEETLGFAVAAAILDRNRCNQCHNFREFPRTQKRIEDIIVEIESGRMPDDTGPRVSAADLRVLKAWAEAGAPETSDIPIPKDEVPVEEIPVEETPVEETPAPITFAQVKAAIFEPQCVKCHKGFSDYTKVKDRLSDIQNAININKMPKDAAPLSDELKLLLANWIEQGAPE